MVLHRESYEYLSSQFMNDHLAIRSEKVLDEILKCRQDMNVTWRRMIVCES